MKQNQPSRSPPQQRQVEWLPALRWRWGFRILSELTHSVLVGQFGQHWPACGLPARRTPTFPSPDRDILSSGGASVAGGSLWLSLAQCHPPAFPSLLPVSPTRGLSCAEAGRKEEVLPSPIRRWRECVFAELLQCAWIRGAAEEAETAFACSGLRSGWDCGG